MNNRTNVEEYLKATQTRFDKMVRNEDTGKYLLEIPIILSAIIAPTAIALGKSTDWAIAGAAIATGGGAGSAYQQPRLRISHTVQARRAIGCVRREYLAQIGTATAWGFATVDASGNVTVTAEGLALTGVTNQLTDAGRYAAGAADDIVANLKLRLGDLGQAPNFDNIVSQLRTSYNAAAANGTTALAALRAVKHQLADDPGRQAAVQEIAAYSTRLRECVAATSA
jgi:hypothetical protein